MEAAALYAQPGVADACLKLQDEFGLDVNLVLFCIWSRLLLPSVCNFPQTYSSSGNSSHSVCVA